MEKLHLKIMIKSAKVFKQPNFFSKMRLYAVAAVIEADSPSSSQTTMADTDGGAQPCWWFPMNFQIDKSKLQSDQNRDTKLLLCIKRLNSNVCFNKSVVGKVQIPVNLLLNDYRLNSPGNCPKNAAFMVQSRSGKPRGVIYLSYLFGGEEMNMSLRRLPPLMVPSAPPLPEDENNGCIWQLLPTAIPSAPYLLLEQ